MAYFHSPPFSVVHENGSASGMDREILEAIAKQMDIQLEMVTCPFNRCLLLMADSELDLMMGLIKTEARAEFLNFVEPPYYSLRSSYSFYKLNSKPFTVSAYEDLYDHSIAHTRGGVYFPRFNQDHKLRKVPLMTETQQLQLLLRGRVDLVISVDETFDFVLRSMGVDDQLEKVAYQEFYPVSSYMSLSKKSEFNKRINDFGAAIQTLRINGKLPEILAKYGIEEIPSSQGIPAEK
ncbi:transporter substrate-binding domain-containing protein [Aliiglaciecola sp. CAU 1673]|uniref:substrate-binding periplasmic protein n=1 Tax=Aliiglaciecola sp. CAU 1673 TaxID=3032595 RepID=UPI0023DB72E8|nr:transporter substrate-binding domain-containing protein [Aliiglaciecola sp. CAU 1673]MDF2177955.1 transporter substrate-binding domain-containing protein [Aliiglaciecola sp. CAU 1673]